jgi:hypothetical protein
LYTPGNNAPIQDLVSLAQRLEANVGQLADIMKHEDRATGSDELLAWLEAGLAAFVQQ